MPTGATFEIIFPQDTPNIGRYKINYNFSILSFSSITGISASRFTNPNPTTQTVGGIPVGSTFAGDYYLQDMMDLLLYPAITPNFTSFYIDSESTDREIGLGTTTTPTFIWNIANATDLEPNTITIADTTSSTVLAASLANDGTETIFASAVSKSSPGTNVWTISAEDSDGNSFSRKFSISWRYMVFYGSNASTTLSDSDIVSLSETELRDDVNGNYDFDGSNYGYICVPDAFSTPSGFQDASTLFPIEMAGPNEGYSSFDGAFFYDPVVVTRNGVDVTYRVYRTKNTTSSTEVIVRSTGGTTSTLQSVINAGSSATGNVVILGNFSATTIFSGDTELGQLFSSLSNIPTLQSVIDAGSVATGNTAILGNFTASTIFSGNTELGELIGSLSSIPNLSQVTQVGNSSDADILMIGNDARIEFHGQTPDSGATAPFIGIWSSYFGGGGLEIQSPMGISYVGRAPLTDITDFPFSVASNYGFHHSFSQDRDYAYVDPVIIQFLSAGTHHFASIFMTSTESTDYSKRGVLLMATGDTASGYPVSRINFPSRSGNLALIDDISNINIQEGVNIYTGGTPEAPTINVSDNPSFSSVSAITISANTIFSAGTELSSFFSDPTFIQGGTNTYTGGTSTHPTINVVDSPVFVSLTASTIFSGSSELSTLLPTPTYIQDGVNTYTGGTISRPTINVSATPSFTSISATTITGNTIITDLIVSGGTNLTSIITGISKTVYVKRYSATTITAALSDSYGFIVPTAATAVTIIIPNESSINFPIGSQMVFKQGGAGQLRFSGATGVTLDSYGNAKNTVGQHATCFITKEASNYWIIDGNLTTLSL